MNNCSICYNKLENRISCNNCKINVEDPKDICNECIIKLEIYRVYLMLDGNTIEDENINDNTKCNNVMIQYTCPFCKELSDYNVDNIKDKNKLIISIVKHLLMLLYNSHEIINNIISERIKLKRKINILENKDRMNSIISTKCSLVMIIVCLNSSLLLVIILIRDILNIL